MPGRNEALGVDYDAAVEARRKRLAASLRYLADGRRVGQGRTSARGLGHWIGCSPNIGPTAASPSSTRRPGAIMRPVSGWSGGYVLKDGRRLGQASRRAITTAVADTLYEKLLIVRETDAGGNVIERERRTTVNHAMKTCRRAWNVAAAAIPASCRTSTRSPDGADIVRPRDADRDLRGAPELSRQGEGDGLQSLATAALIAWEWLQRETDIFGASASRTIGRKSSRMRCA